MNTTMQSINLFKSGMAAMALLPFTFQPLAEAASSMIHRWWLSAFAVEVLFKGTDPGAVLHAGKEQGKVFLLQLLLTAPVLVWLPLFDPIAYLFSRHGFGNTVTLGQFAAQLQQDFALADGFDPFGDRF